VAQYGKLFAVVVVAVVHIVVGSMALVLGPDIGLAVGKAVVEGLAVGMASAFVAVGMASAFVAVGKASAFVAVGKASAFEASLI